MTGRRAAGGWIDRCECQGRHRPSPASRDRRALSPLLLLTAAVGLFWPAAIAAETYDPPVTTLVTNMEQSSGSNSSVTLYSGQTGFDQRFRTGPNPAGYQLQCIWLLIGA